MTEIDSLYRPGSIKKSSKIEKFQNLSMQLFFRKWHGLYYLKRELLIKNGEKITLKSARNLDFHDFHFTDPDTIQKYKNTKDGKPA